MQKGHVTTQKYFFKIHTGHFTTQNDSLNTGRTRYNTKRFVKYRQDTLQHKTIHEIQPGHVITQNNSLNTDS